MKAKQLSLKALILILLFATTVQAQGVSDLLQKGVYEEETAGNLDSAIKTYEQIVANENADRPHVAQATYRLGMCYLKKGQKQTAITTFENLIEKFPNQAQLIDRAHGALTVLGHVPDSEGSGVKLEDVWAYSGLSELDVQAISRDGRYCAFVDKTGGMSVRDLKNGVDQRIAETAPAFGQSANWQRASISPDNKWIAYVGRVQEPEPRPCVKIVQLDGSHPRVLYPNEERSVIRDLDWSADGQHLLASMVDTRGQQDDFNTVPIRIATISLTDGSLKLLKKLSPSERNGPGPKPQFSPDGRYVAYAKVMDEMSQQEDIFLIPLDGSPEIHLIDDPADDDVLGWMPDGRGLVFRSNRGGDVRDAWLVQLDNGKPIGNPEMVASDVYSNLEGPVRTPNGGWAFYQKHQERFRSASDIYLATLDFDTGELLSSPQAVSRPAPGRDRCLSPDFSRDGKLLAYYVAPNREKTKDKYIWEPGNIVIRSLETGHERRVVISPQFSDRGMFPFLRWAPDGRSLLVQGADMAGRWGIYQVDVETGTLSPVVLHDPETAAPTWSLGRKSAQVEGDVIRFGEWSVDGKTVFYGRNRMAPVTGEELGIKDARLIARNLQTGIERVVCQNPVGVASIAVSPDGEQVLLAGKESLKIVPSAGGVPREIHKLDGESSNRIRWRIAWMPDGQSLLYVKSVERRAELWKVPVESGQPERIAQLPDIFYKGEVEELRVHPDGQQISFASYRYYAPYTTRMMKISPEWAKHGCIENLHAIGEAMKRYEQDHGVFPEQLSNLYPEYLQDANILICRSHDERQTTRRSYDLNMPSSYQYAPVFHHSTLPIIFSDEPWTKSKILESRIKYFGGRAGLVRCGEHHLHLTHDGKTHESSWWGADGRADKGLLTQLKVAMESNPETWLEDYDIPKLAFILEDRPALTKLLSEYIDAHPENRLAKLALTQAEQVRFVNRSEDDATELSDGQIELQEIFCTLGGVERSGNRAVGFRFSDIPVRPGARIKRAYVRFDSTAHGRWGNEGLTFHGELTANAESFQNGENNISSRPKTVASVKCPPSIWDPGTRDLRTSNLASVIQEIVAQPDWREGNALVLIVSGSSHGEATAWDQNRGHRAAMLYVEVE